jgi:hypothetical protein
VSLCPCRASPHARLPICQSPRGERDNAALQHLHTTHGNSPLDTRPVHDAPSGSSNEATQSENSLSAPGTSYDDVPDSIPTDDFVEEELGSYDDEFEDTPAPSKGKGKAIASSRARIESDDEDGYDDDGHAEDAAAAARGPAWFAPYLAQSTTATKADPSFSILPLSPPKRVGLPATSPQRLSVHAPGLFSPRVKSGVNIPTPPPVLSDEEQEVRTPFKLLCKPLQVVPDASPRPDGLSSSWLLDSSDDDYSGTSKEPAAPTPVALKDDQHECPFSTISVPELSLNLSVK